MSKGKEKRVEIIAGPNKFDLMTALFVRGTPEVEFTFKEVGVTNPSFKVKAVVLSVGKEDGSCESWLIDINSLDLWQRIGPQGQRDISGENIGNEVRYHFYYETRQRHGTLILKPEPLPQEKTSSPMKPFHNVPLDIK